MKNITFPIKYTSLNIIKTDKNKITNTITKNKILRKEDVKKNFVVIKVKFANLNYKDFLISQGHSGLVKKFPHTPGIDASGTIYFSNSNKFRKNDKVYVIAHPLGVETDGSFSEYIIIPDRWVEKLPKNLTSKEVMMIGTSGLTAVKALKKTFKTIIRNKNKPVLVTGAMGNVGMFLIFLLTNIGANIEAVTSKTKNNIILKKMGVKKIHVLKNFIQASNFALLNEKYSTIFENLGGDAISVSLKYLIKKGVLVSIGNVLGNNSNINILPLILREVNILSVNAECTSAYERKNILKEFKSIKLKKQLLKKTKIINLKQVSKLFKLKNYNKKTFRYIVKI
jgi:putative YhdH/YhfP family quinone oxidoreductase